MQSKQIFPFSIFIFPFSHLYLIPIGMEEFEFQQAVFLRLLHFEVHAVLALPTAVGTLEPTFGEIGVYVGVGGPGTNLLPIPRDCM